MNQRNTTTIPVFTIGEMRRMAKRQLAGKWLRVLPAMLLFVVLVSLPSIVIQLDTYLSGDFADMLGEYYGESVGSILPETVNIRGLHSLAFVFMIYTFLTAGAFSVSLALLSLRILRNQEFSIKTVFSGFSEFGKSFLTYLLVTIFSLLWTFLFLIPGALLLSMSVITSSLFVSFLMSMLFFILMICLVIFLLRYQLAFFIAADEKGSAREAVSKSVRLMKGNVSNFFLLQLSFIPWILLLMVPISIAMYAFFSAVTGGSALYSVLSLVFTVISIVGYALLQIYMQTAAAVFYSGASGNFRSTSEDADSSANAFSGESATSGISGISELSGTAPGGTSEAGGPADAVQNGTSEAGEPTGAANTQSGADGQPHQRINLQKEAVSGSSDGVSPDRNSTDETLTLLESDDSLDSLYEEDEEKSAADHTESAAPADFTSLSGRRENPEPGDSADSIESAEKDNDKN